MCLPSLFQGFIIGLLYLLHACMGENARVGGRGRLATCPPPPPIWKLGGIMSDPPPPSSHTRKCWDMLLWLHTVANMEFEILNACRSPFFFFFFFFFLGGVGNFWKHQCVPYMFDMREIVVTMASHLQHSLHLHTPVDNHTDTHRRSLHTRCLLHTYQGYNLLQI